MVHTFNCLGRRFAVDTYSGSFFEIDALTQEIIDKFKNSSMINMEEFSRYPKEDVASALREIEILKRESVLFSAPPIIDPPEFKGIIKSMCLNISHDCNLDCAYCFADGGGYGTHTMHMPLATAKAAIDFLIASSGKAYNLEVDFFGGEPLLNFDVVQKTVAYARSLEKKHNKNFRFTLTTNAMYMPDSAIQFINLEMENVVLSIDGRENVHNSMRKTKNGKDSFAHVVENAKKLIAGRGDKSYFVRGTFTSHNIDFVQDVLALRALGFEQISLEPVTLPASHSAAIGMQHVSAICDEYERLAAEYIARRAGDDWFSFFHFNLNLYDGPCEQKLLRSCGAGCAYIAVTPEGKIYPCHQFVGNDVYLIGDVIKGTYDKTVPLKFGRQNHVLEKPECDRCWAKYYCGGGCAAQSVKYSGGLAQSDTLSCTLMKKRVECALAIWAIEND